MILDSNQIFRLWSDIRMTNYHKLINYTCHFFYQKDAAISGTDNNEVYCSIQTPNIPE